MSATELGWQLDEAGARGYEDNLVRIFMDPWARDLLERVGVGAGASLLDIGTGTGIVARLATALIGPSGRIVGVDVNPAMLAVAGELSADLTPAIDLRQASAEELPFDDGTFSIVVAQQVLPFCDHVAALAEFHRVSTPGARLGIATCGSLPHQPGYRVLVDRLEHHLGVEAARTIASPYSFGDVREVRGAVEAAGFTDIVTNIAVTSVRFPSAAAFVQAELSSSPLADTLASLDADVLEGLVADLGGALASHTDDDGIVFPFETLTVTATRPA
ncbi:MAG: methyltransferase domain-containing protein [Actinobacteria bacterium]|nr:methyltransferase domain-containing protein [Actinomycetota bacterium]